MNNSTEITTKIQNNRIFTYDFIRAFAMIAVILLHSSADFVSNFLPHSTQFTIGNIFNSISRLGVPLFVMLSGIFMLDENRPLPKEKLMHKILKLTIILLVWSTFYALIYHYKKLFHHIFFGYVHLWYLYMTIGLYIITPILRLFVKKINIKYLYYFVILSVIFQFCPKTIDIILGQHLHLYKFMNQFQLNILFGYTTYYILGWLIANDWEKINKHTKFIYSVGIISLITIFAGSQIYTTELFKAYKIFYNNLGILNFIYSIAIFIFIKNIIQKFEDKIPKHIKNSITTISNLSLGIYLIHMYVLKTIKSILSCDLLNVTPNNTNPAILIVLFLILTFTLSFFIIFILNKIKGLNKIIHM